MARREALQYRDMIGRRAAEAIGREVEREPTQEEREYATLFPILDAIREERDRQDGLWGVPPFEGCSPTFWLGILAEEVGESARDAVEIEDGRKGDDGHLDEELVQVAAVAVSWLQDRAIKRMRSE